MSDLVGESIKLQKLFSHEFFFNIPVYQRPFRWGTENLSDLVLDLIKAPKDTDYFLGTLVLHKTADHEYDIVDGQQRLTALCLLLACIRDTDHFAGDQDLAEPLQDMVVQKANRVHGIPRRNRLVVREPRLFDTVISTKGGTKGTLGREPSDPSETRYYEACRIFHTELNSLTPIELEQLATYISTRCLLMYLSTSDFENAFRLFTIVNDRGLQLRRIDVLKSNNLQPSHIANDVVRANYARQWQEMEESLGEEEFERVFHLLRLIYTKAKPEGDLLTEFQEKILGKPLMPLPGQDFIDQLATFVRLYDSIFVTRDYLDGRAEHLPFRALIAIMVDEFPASEWKACCLHFAAIFGKPYFFDFLLQIEGMFLQHWVEGVRKDERLAEYITILRKVDEVTNERELLSSPFYDGKPVAEACRRENFYNSGFSKYFLLRLEVLASECKVDKHFTARSVEHVLPQTPPLSGQWATWFPDPDEARKYADQAGNLVLLSKSKNSSASNREFDEKKDRYLRDRVTDYPRSMGVLAYTEWTPETIAQRTDEIATMILRDPRLGVSAP